MYRYMIHNPSMKPPPREPRWMLTHNKFALKTSKKSEEARKTLKAQTQHDCHGSEYKDQLERKRQVKLLEAQKYMQE